jgi:hypothetical protein
MSIIDVAVTVNEEYVRVAAPKALETLPRDKVTFLLAPDGSLLARWGAQTYIWNDNSWVAFNQQP